jgi:hypothetical protein
LPVGKAHFDRWLELFLETVDENFSGPKAEEAKGRALSIADTFARPDGRAAAPHRPSAAVKARQRPSRPKVIGRSGRPSSTVMTGAPNSDSVN